MSAVEYGTITKAVLVFFQRVCVFRLIDLVVATSPQESLDFIHNKVSLLFLVNEPTQSEKRTRGILAPKLASEWVGIVGDDASGGFQNALTGTEILFQFYQLRFRELFLKPLENSHI